MLAGEERENVERIIRGLELAVGLLSAASDAPWAVQKGKKKKQVGDYGKFGPGLYVKISEIPGAGQKNWKYIGKAPKDWKEGDPVPEGMQSAAATTMDQLDVDPAPDSNVADDSPQPKGVVPPEGWPTTAAYDPPPGIVLITDEDSGEVGFMFEDDEGGEVVHLGQAPDGWDAESMGMTPEMKEAFEAQTKVHGLATANIPWEQLKKNPPSPPGPGGSEPEKAPESMKGKHVTAYTPPPMSYVVQTDDGEVTLHFDDEEMEEAVGGEVIGHAPEGWNAEELGMTPEMMEAAADSFPPGMVDWEDQAHDVLVEEDDVPSSGLTGEDVDDMAAGVDKAPVEALAWKDKGNDQWNQMVSASKNPKGLFDALAGMTKTLGGSTGAQLVTGMYTDTATGKETAMSGVFKTGASLGHAQEENIANGIYNALGFKAKRSQMVTSGNKQGMLSEWMDGKLVNELSSLEKKEAEKEIQKGFALDALLGNWDVTGAGLDNIMKTPDGSYVRIDNGGSLRYRAQGALKLDFPDVVQEIDSMRQMDPAAQVFASLSDAEVVNQINDLWKKRGVLEEALQHSGDDELRTKVMARLANMKERADKIAAEAGSADEEAKAMADKSNPLRPRMKGGFSQAERQKFRDAQVSGVGAGMPPIKKAHKNPLHSYQGGSYILLNARLRNHEELTSAQKETMQAIDDYISATPLKEHRVCRSVGSGLMKNVFAGVGMPDITILSPADANKEYAPGITKLDVMKQYLVGMTVGENNYGSTTNKPGKFDDWSFGFDGTKGISASKGCNVQLFASGMSRGAELNHIEGYQSSHYEEHETLLPRGQRHRIKDVQVVKVSSYGTTMRLITELVDPVVEH